jgi:hypothetical protein
MANDLLKKDYVKTIIHLFLLEIERKKFNNIPLSQDELRWISNKQNLLYYVYEQKTHPVYTTDQNVAREDKKSTIGESTIYNAIREMEDDGIIECKNRQFQIKRTSADLVTEHPIIKIAPQLQVTNLPLDDIALFRVPKRYASEIAHYINTQFYCNDICCVATGGFILCFDIKLPPQSKFITKREPLVKRVTKVLRKFNLAAIKDSDEYTGYTEAEIEQQHAKLSLTSHEHQAAQEVSYGGKIVVPVKRKIKKKP